MAANKPMSNIRIENNRFFTFDVGILYARSVDGIRFAGNTVRRTASYPATRRMDHPLTFEACRNIEVEDNHVGEHIMEPLMRETGVGTA